MATEEEKKKRNHKTRENKEREEGRGAAVRGGGASPAPPGLALGRGSSGQRSLGETEARRAWGCERGLCLSGELRVSAGEVPLGDEDGAPREEQHHIPCLPPATQQQSSSPRRARPCGPGTGEAPGRRFSSGGNHAFLTGSRGSGGRGGCAGGGDRTCEPSGGPVPSAGPGKRRARAGTAPKAPAHLFTRALTGGSC